jgi:hypothetical protein
MILFKKFLYKAFLLCLISILFNSLLFTQNSLFPFYYGETLKKIWFLNVDGEKIVLPQNDNIQICFFLSQNPRNINCLNKLLYKINAYKPRNKTYIFLDTSKKYLKIKNIPYSYIFTRDKNKEKKQIDFFNQGCSQCFSMLIIKNFKVIFYSRGYDYYLFSGVIKSEFEVKNEEN